MCGLDGCNAHYQSLTGLVIAIGIFAARSHMLVPDTRLAESKLPVQNADY